MKMVSQIVFILLVMRTSKRSFVARKAITLMNSAPTYKICIVRSNANSSLLITQDYPKIYVCLSI